MANITIARLNQQISKTNEMLGQYLQQNSGAAAGATTSSPPGTGRGRKAVTSASSSGATGRRGRRAQNATQQ